jgi:hypothetical protein
MIARRPKTLAAVTVAALALTAAGCGSGGGSVSTSFDPSSGGRPPNTAAFQKFQSCLANHGLKLPSGGAPPGGGQPPTGGQPPNGGGLPGGGGAKAQRAFQACQQYMPRPPGGGGFPGAP